MSRASGLKLNKEQLGAIKYGEGPLLIIAGAGTGKTTVITERVTYLVSKGLAKPEEILALTFTEKATREMEERIDSLLPYGYTQMWVMTFHSFCERVLKSEALDIGLDPKFKLLTSAESIALVRKNIFDFNLEYFRPLGNPNKFIYGMLQHFSRLQDEDISPAEYFAWVKSKTRIKKLNTTIEDKLEMQKWTELASAYKKYDQLKTKEGKMDFGDLISKTLLLFRSRPNVLARYKSQFKYILIDEFQDTNYAQNELAKLLSGKNGNITAVADDDQAIYRFRGASVSNVVQFRLSFPNTKVVVLSKNYRSTQTILNCAYELIQNNNPDRLEVVENINKKLISQISKKGGKIEFIHTDRVENEAEEVCRCIEKLTTKDSFKYKDIAILIRANSHADPFVAALQRKAIPHQFLGPGKLFQQEEISELISYLKLLYDISDSAAFYKVASMKCFDIDGEDLAKLSVLARKNYTSLYEVAQNFDKEGISGLVSLIKNHLNLLKNEPVGFILYDFLKENGILKALVDGNNPSSEKIAGNITKFFDKIKTFETDNPGAGIAELVSWIDTSIELGESPLATNTDWSEENAVNILTIHSAKGLEFPVVFLVNLVDQRFPSMNRSDQIPISQDLIKEILPQGNFHVQEERRLFYVGMTRAKEKLFLTASDYYGDAKRQKKLSPFISEALGGRGVRILSRKTKVGLPNYQKAKLGKQIKEKNKLNINYLSVSQIETFKICPLHYKLRYLYKIPTPSSASASFGISIHETLKEFYKAVARGEKPTKELFHDLLKKNWIREGFENKTHEKKFFEKGKMYLSGFLENGFDPKTKPALLEEPFIVPLGNNFKIGGKIDRVDLKKDGSLEIVDYKTGASVPTQKEVDKDLQLSFYALAATKIKNKVLGKSPKNIVLSLYFLDTQEKISTKRTKAQLDEAIKEIKKIKKEIESSDFTCSNHYFCQNRCEYSMFCKSEG